MFNRKNISVRIFILIEVLYFKDHAQFEQFKLVNKSEPYVKVLGYRIALRLSSALQPVNVTQQNADQVYKEAVDIMHAACTWFVENYISKDESNNSIYKERKSMKTINQQYLRAKHPEIAGGLDLVIQVARPQFVCSVRLFSRHTKGEESRLQFLDNMNNPYSFAKANGYIPPSWAPCSPTRNK